jgi:hypothetical protein
MFETALSDPNLKKKAGFKGRFLPVEAAFFNFWGLYSAVKPMGDPP